MSEEVLESRIEVLEEQVQRLRKQLKVATKALKKYQETIKRFEKDPMNNIIMLAHQLIYDIGVDSKKTLKEIEGIK